MEKFGTLSAALFIFAVAFHQALVEAKFSNSMYITWGTQHAAILGNGDDLQLVLDQTSGSAAQSKKPFLFGSIEMLIKLVPGNSAGTVTAYYLSSTGTQYDEIDFEFLGNISGQPYILHTNLYTQGKGNREQQFYLWFDPTADFHNYTIHWNPTEIVWYIDGLPIRVFRNYEEKGIAYPNKQGMRVYTSLWNADDWATRGGLVKTDWSSAPFIARLRHFRARACKWNGPVSIGLCAAKTPANWWTSTKYSQLTYGQIGQLNWVRKNHMIYDYCSDTKRFNGRMAPNKARSTWVSSPRSIPKTAVAANVVALVTGTASDIGALPRIAKKVAEAERFIKKGTEYCQTERSLSQFLRVKRILW